MFRNLTRLLTWLSILLAIATVAAVSAIGFGLLAVPLAHADLDPPTVSEITYGAWTHSLR